MIYNRKTETMEPEPKNMDLSKAKQNLHTHARAGKHCDGSVFKVNLEKTPLQESNTTTQQESLSSTAAYRSRSSQLCQESLFPPLKILHRPASPSVKQKKNQRKINLIFKFYFKKCPPFLHYKQVTRQLLVLMSCFYPRQPLLRLH